MDLFEIASQINKNKEHKADPGPLIRRKHTAKTPKEKDKKGFGKSGKVYASIKDALTRGYHGEIFSTPSSEKNYIITKPKWGKKSKLSTTGKTAKHYTPGDEKPKETPTGSLLSKAKKVKFKL